jgi:acetoin utilization protein AcuB
MLAEELIVDNIPPLKPSDTGETALNWMDDFKVMHLCVVENQKYLGTVSESDILSITDIGESLSKHKELFNPVYVKQSQHIFEVVKVVNDHQLSITPVLDEREQYLGAITIAQLMNIIADMPVANSPGGIIVLELNYNDYSLAHISSIIEENNTKILGTFITSHADSTKIQLTIKVNSVDISSIISSLQRHEYVITFFNQSLDAGVDLRDRFDSFMNYINI